jgi:tripartite-type tricarboxylate transporter receptor subunit TctC
MILGGGCANAQSYPDRPIRIIVPFAGGSASDVLARVVINHIGENSGKSYVVDNRPGGGGNIGTVAAARAEPDGYTLLMNGLPLVVSKMLLDNPGFDLGKNFEPIALYAIVPNILAVHADLPINSVTEFIAYAKSRPKEINYASVGIGSSQHLAGAYFEHMAGVEMTHVPYRVTSQLVSDMISGRVHDKTHDSASECANHFGGWRARVRCRSMVCILGSKGHTKADNHIPQQADCRGNECSIGA